MGFDSFEEEGFDSTLKDLKASKDQKWSFRQEHLNKKKGGKTMRAHMTCM